HEQKLEHIAHYDALTSLPNRTLLADRLQQAMLHSMRRDLTLAVAYLDLDNFKPINDHYGHETGDLLLMAIAQSMKGALREGDTLARIGGDEFVAVLVDLERPRDCEPVLERMLKAATEPITVDGSALQVSVSIGVTLYPQDGADAEQLLRHADQAMYAAKQAGRNRYHLFDVDSAVAVQTQRESLELIRQALLNDQFLLHYQPKVNMKTGRVLGAEALIRWQHPQRGLLAPAQFLPLIEDHSIGIEVGEWVISTALAQMASWQCHGLNLPVSVNISARQFQQENFSQRLTLLLGQHPQLEAHLLELEILETSALGDIERASRTMNACHAIGVRFSLDDFGTGYSSLTFLKHLPAEILKIDRSFVCDMLANADDLAIVSGVIGLARAFGRKVIAEGVETESHGLRLMDIGCDLAQGFCIAKQMPADALPEWVANWKPFAAWSE
ncbi:MAG: putative bifunctional diguanylate cyclase/phosphodiesterase, partial [Rhodoferax sp.]